MRSHGELQVDWSEHAQRLRFFGLCTLLLFFAGWLAWFYPFDDAVDRSGTPLGGDFIMLYVAGQAVAGGEAVTLYDDALNQQRTLRVCPSLDPTSTWPFRYPPITALAMSIPARLPFAMSFGVFFTVSAFCLCRSLYALAEHYELPAGSLRTSVLIALVGCPLVVETLIGGQTSTIALAILVGSLMLYSRQRYAMAGAVLGLAMYKPNILALFGLGMVLLNPRLLLGLVPVGLGGLALSLWTVGIDGFREYVRLSGALASATWQVETPVWKVHGLAPWLDSWLPGHGRAACLAIGLALVAWLSWRQRTREIPWDVHVSLLLMVNALFNPYVPIYDMVLLVPACFMLMRQLTLAYPVNRWQGRLIVGIGLSLFFGPHVSQVACQATGVQFFPVWLFILMLAVMRWQFPGAQRDAQLDRQRYETAGSQC